MNQSVITDSCEVFCRGITQVVFSKAPDESVTLEVGQRLHRILNSSKEEILLYRKDFDPALFNNAPMDKNDNRGKNHASEACQEGHHSKNGICPTTGLPCMVKISHPEQFLIGKSVGELIRKARAGTLTQPDFFHALFKCMSGQHELTS